MEHSSCSHQTLLKATTVRYVPLRLPPPIHHPQSQPCLCPCSPGLLPTRSGQCSCSLHVVLSVHVHLDPMPRPGGSSLPPRLVPTDYPFSAVRIAGRVTFSLQRPGSRDVTLTVTKDINAEVVSTSIIGDDILFALTLTNATALRRN